LPPWIENRTLRRALQQPEEILDCHARESFTNQRRRNTRKLAR
jgi:hypothetical protein